VSEVLEYVPARFKVIRHVRPKLSYTRCDGIVQAEAASRPMERGLAGPGLLATSRRPRPNAYLSSLFPRTLLLCTL
jgi:transposase